jgi:diguanylate cyclase (GGDEF)-like protein
MRPKQVQMVDSFNLEHGAHISGSTTAVTLRWVRGNVGEEGVRRLLLEAGDTRSPAELEDLDSWSSYKQATNLLEAAVRVTGRTDAARRIGEEMLAQHRATPVVDLLRSLGSPEALLTSIAESGAKFSTVFTLTPQQIGPGHATVVGTTPAGVPRHRLLCDFTIGILSIVPTVFDLAPALVAHPQCQARDGSCCTYSLTWDPTLPAVHSEQLRVDRLEDRLDGLQLQLDALRSTAAELVAADDIDAALDLVGRRAGAAVRATSYLLAVRMPGEERLRVRGWGMTDGEAETLVPQLLQQGTAPSRIVVDIASRSGDYGILAALFPEEATFFRQEQDLLTAYAGYAASALDTAWALAAARQQNRTARALLDLSRALSQVAAPADVAQRLSEAVPAVVGCDNACVLLWEEETQLLRLAGSVNVAPGAVEQLARGIGIPDTPALTEMLARREPLFLHPDDPDPFLRGVLTVSGVAAAVVVPIVQGRDFLGVVTAGAFHETTRFERNQDLLERLEGVAHQAATALTNAFLVTQLQRQALSDPLTELPNRAAMVAAVDLALAVARRSGTDCALLYVDLDGFKRVNDVLGHLAGDELLVQVAARLRAIVRQGEIVARLGGDEFAILQPVVQSSNEPQALALRVTSALSEPFVLAEADGASAAIGASVGFALASAGVDTAMALLREADRVMYRVKAADAGRCRSSVTVPAQRAAAGALSSLDR